jgi:hypothetical protein
MSRPRASNDHDTPLKCEEPVTGATGPGYTGRASTAGVRQNRDPPRAPGMRPGVMAGMHTGYGLEVILSRLTLLLTAVAAGALLGPGDLLAQRALPYPWANLANSSACGRSQRSPSEPGRRAAANDQAPGRRRPPSCCCSSRWRPTTSPRCFSWTTARPSSGRRRPCSGSSSPWSPARRSAPPEDGPVERAGLRRALGAALPTAVLLAEAGLLATRPDNGDAAYRTDSLQTAAIEVALAALCLLIAARDARQRVQALAMSLPLAATALAAFRLAGSASDSATAPGLPWPGWAAPRIAAAGTKGGKRLCGCRVGTARVRWLPLLARAAGRYPARVSALTGDGGARCPFRPGTRRCIVTVRGPDRPYRQLADPTDLPDTDGPLHSTTREAAAQARAAVESLMKRKRTWPARRHPQRAKRGRRRWSSACRHTARAT